MGGAFPLEITMDLIGFVLFILAVNMMVVATFTPLVLEAIAWLDNRKN